MEKMYIDEVIDGHIAYIRRMSMLTDTQLRALFRKAISEKPEILEIFKEDKKVLLELRKMAKKELDLV